MHRAPLGKSIGKHPPLAATLEQIQQRIEYLVKVYSARLGALAYPFKQGTDTPKHGSWLNIAEIELSALSGQCLDRRIPAIDLMRREVAAWELDRNKRNTTIDWRFTTEDARIKLKRLYPKL